MCVTATSCNGTCGTCPSNQSCTNGACVTVTKPTWTTQTGANLTGLALDPGGKLYVSGQKAGAGFLAAIDPQAGTMGATATVGPASSGLDVVRLAMGTLLVAAGAYQTASVSACGYPITLDMMAAARAVVVTSGFAHVLLFEQSQAQILVFDATVTNCTVMPTATIPIPIGTTKTEPTSMAVLGSTA